MHAYIEIKYYLWTLSLHSKFIQVQFQEDDHLYINTQQNKKQVSIQYLMACLSLNHAFFTHKSFHHPKIRSHSFRDNGNI